MQQLNGYANAKLGDLRLIGQPTAKLAKALAVIASDLHSGFDLHSLCTPGISKRSCVLASLTVRDVLRAIGFTSAEVRPVAVTMWATRAGDTLHSLGLGHPTDKRKSTRENWVGHMVVLVDDFLIDTTLYPCLRPQWPDLTGMAAVPLNKEAADNKLYDLPILAGLLIGDSDTSYEFNTVWLDNPKNRGWRRGPDCNPKRRAGVVQHLVDCFVRSEAA